MFEIPHDFHLVVDLLIQDTVLHEAPLIQLFRRIDCTMLLRCQLVNRCECALSDLTGHIVHRTACPMHAIRIGD